MKYTIYKTTNLINGMFYIGKHQTENENDGYYGSGAYLERAIKKYGKENFKKEVLFVFDTEEEMNKKERELIQEELVDDSRCYNLMFGGEGGDTWTGRHHSEETKKKLSDIAKRNLEKSGEEGHLRRSEKQKEIWEKLRKNPEKLKEINRKRSETRKRQIAENPSLVGHKLSEETKRKISESMKKFWKK